jgi:Fe2+ transport system protein B
MYEKTTANILDLGPNDDKKKAAASLKVYKDNLKAQAKLLSEMRKRAALSMNQSTKPIADSYDQDIKNAQKEEQDRLAFQLKNIKEKSAITLNVIKEQYQTEVSEAEGSYEKIKKAQENMRASLDASFKDKSLGLIEYSKAVTDLVQEQNKAALKNAEELMAQTVKIGIGIMNALGPALDLLLEKGANIGEILTKAFQDIIKKLVKVAITAAIAVAIMSMIPGLIQPGKGLATFGNLVAGGMGMASDLFGGGTGTDATKATNAINTIQTTPAGDNSGQFVLRGNDLVLALNRSETSLNLRRGA